MEKERSLRNAANRNQIEVVKALFKQGIDVNAAGSDSKKTALHWAVERQYAEMTKLLLAAGADPTVLDSSNNTPITLANNKNNNLIKQMFVSYVNPKPEVESRLLYAALFNHCKHVKSCIAEGVNVNAQPFPATKETALHLATSNLNCDLILLLFSAGANLNIKNAAKMSCVDLIIKNNNQELINLFEYMSDLDIPNETKTVFIQHLIEYRLAVPVKNESILFINYHYIYDLAEDSKRLDLAQPVDIAHFQRLEDLSKEIVEPLDPFCKQIMQPLILPLKTPNEAILNRAVFTIQITRFIYGFIRLKRELPETIKRWRLPIANKLKQSAIPSAQMHQEVKRCKQETKQTGKDLMTCATTLLDSIRKFTDKVVQPECNPCNNGFLNFIQQYFPPQFIVHLTEIWNSSDELEGMYIAGFDQFYRNSKLQFQKKLQEQQTLLNQTRLQAHSVDNVDIKCIDEIFTEAEHQHEFLSAYNLSIVRNYSGINELFSLLFPMYFAVEHCAQVILQTIASKDSILVKQIFQQQQENLNKTIAAAQPKSSRLLELSEFDQIKLQERKYLKKIEQSRRVEAEQKKLEVELQQQNNLVLRKESVEREQRKYHFQEQILSRLHHSTSALNVLQNIIVNNNNEIQEKEFLSLVQILQIPGYEYISKDGVHNNKLRLKLGEFGKCGTHLKHGKDRDELLDPEFIKRFRLMLHAVGIDRELLLGKSKLASLVFKVNTETISQ